MNPAQSTSPQFSILLGALFSVCAAVPAAILTAVFYRFPIGMGGYVSVPELLLTKGLVETTRLFPGLVIGIALTVGIYGIRGWYAAMAIMGGIGGLIAHQSSVNCRATIRRNLIIACILGMFFALVNANV